MMQNQIDQREVRDDPVIELLKNAVAELKQTSAAIKRSNEVGELIIQRLQGNMIDYGRRLEGKKT